MEITSNFDDLDFYEAVTDTVFSIKNISYEEMAFLRDALWFFENELAEPLSDEEQAILDAFANALSFRNHD